jgi:hypothetical protein
MVGLISLFLAIQKTKTMDQMNLFSLVDPAKPCLLPSPRQTVHWHVAFPKFEEASALPELFLIEEQFIWLMADVIAKTDG